MTQFPYQQSGRYGLDYGTETRVSFNFFNTVYAWMSVGLAVTAVVAWVVATYTQIPFMMGRGLTIVAFLGLFALSFGVQSAAMRIGAGVATGLFLLYSAILGLMLSPIVLIYRMDTIAASFAITAGTFGTMSVIGFVTKRDLSRLGSFFTMALIGLFIASLVNLFLASGPLSWIITYAVVIIFTGLVAYETQMLKNLAINYANQPRLLAGMAIVGALMLYMSFINLFLAILQILGNRRSN